MNRRDFLKATAALLAAPYVPAQAAQPTPVQVELVEHVAGHNAPKAYYWSRVSCRIDGREWHAFAHLLELPGRTEEESYDLMYRHHQAVLQRHLDKHGLVAA